MMSSASRREHLLATAMLVAVFIYLVPFVPRAWIPHDEGMLGQSAERVLRGGLPHVDYEEAYSGGLTWLYAAAFKIAGIDLVNIRWLLFLAACASTWLLYAILRRVLRPAGAALGVWVAIGWSFPNYFAGLPSWWLLVCALLCLWAIVRHAETDRWPYLIVAGLAAGLAIAVKQTGVYLLIALVITLLYDGARPRSHTARWLEWIDRSIRWAAAAITVAFAAAILAPRITHAEGLYLFCPVVACAVVVLMRPGGLAEAGPYRNGYDQTPERASLLGIAWRSRVPVVLACVAVAAGLVPIGLMIFPYVIHGRVADFVYGWIILPRKRLTSAFAPMKGGWPFLTGVPLVALMFPAPRITSRLPMFYVRIACWAAAIVLPIAALWHVPSYQAIWESSRAIAVLAPIGICWRLAAGRIPRSDHRALLFGAAAILAWTSLNQFPFAAPIYFSYVAPLAIIATIAAITVEPAAPRWTLMPWGVALLMFAVLSTNRTYIESIGVSHEPRTFPASLNLPRAHLRVGPDDSYIYRAVVFTVLTHLRSGELVAGPDCPEVYFLAGMVSPTGALFDFFSEGFDRDDTSPWEKGNVIVINHGPHFSPAPSPELTAKLRDLFPNGQGYGRFEVRWR